MNKKIVWFIVILFVIVVGYVLASTQGSKEEKMAPQVVTNETPEISTETNEVFDTEGVETENVVTYDENGFLPPTITIAQGATVTFTNVSKNPMWVASADHPTHNDLPGFDQKLSAGKGEFYSFAFDQKGNWSYHNHLNPQHAGMVVVE